VDLGAVYHVNTIGVFNREIVTKEILMIGSELRLGNSTTPTENPGCGVSVDDSGFYDCDLWGRYATLRRASLLDDFFVADEIGVWTQKNICPLGVAS